MQQVIYSLDPSIGPLVLPSENAEVMDGVDWGDAGQPFTPAYWRALIHQEGSTPPQLRLGTSLLEEAAACLLGGYGIPAEVGLAAFHRLKERGQLLPGTCAVSILRSLQEPLEVAGSRVRYRFAGTKGQAVWELLERCKNDEAPMEPMALRSWLVEGRGFGLKTASWVVRNHLGCDDVAILDIHLLRAGYLMGLFPAEVSLPRDYLELERRFIELSHLMGVRASLLDACIWAQMKRSGAYALEMFNERRQAEQDLWRQRRASTSTKRSSKSAVRR
jgi:N-glycosylase/DNA lyase